MVNPWLVLMLLLALMMDYIYPFHRGLLYKTHPVHLTYSLATALYRPYSSRLYGVFVWFASVLPIYLTYELPIIAVPTREFGLTLLLVIYSGFVVKLGISLKLLMDIVKEYVDAVKVGDWNKARSIAQQIVRRNVWTIDDAHVNSAVIESLFESLVDGYISPLFYLPILGPLGPLIQRLANTMDSALGYLEEPYRGVGWFSAKVDTAFNYIPARVAAFFILASGILMGYRPSFKIYVRYRASTKSLNAGHPMASASAALGISLEKVGEYRIGEGPLPGIDDVYRALSLAKASAAAYTMVLLAVCLLIPGIKLPIAILFR